MKKRGLAFLLSALMMVSLIPEQIWADVNPAEKTEAKSETKSEEYQEMHNTGYVSPYDDDVEFDVVSSYTAKTSTSGVYADAKEMAEYGASISDSRYVSPYLTAIKNQSPWNLCWTFATMACSEADLIKNSSAEGFTTSNTDLSELQLAYFVANPLPDKLGFMDAAELTSKSFNDGGNYIQAISAIASGMCLTNESVAPIASATPSSILTKDKAYRGDYYLKNAYLISKNDPNSIKQAILNYGAIAVNYAAGETVRDIGENLVDGEMYYYIPLKMSVDHAVTIIGWDDTISRDKFKQAPERDGAWIVRNSWGTDYGNGGIFYLSYCDKSIEDGLFAFDVETGEVADNYYQYDFNDGAFYQSDNAEDEILYPTLNQYVYDKVANVFTAIANPGGYETLEAVSFYTNKGNSKYTIEVYTKMTNPADPESGKRHVIAENEVLDAGGYRTVYLENPITLQEGETYAISVSTVSNDSRNKVYGVAGEMGVNPQAETGQTLFYDNRGWNSSTSYRNAKIKAFTNNHAVGALTSISLAQNEITLQGAGSSYDLISLINEGNASGNVKFESSDTSVVAVNEKGIATAKKAGKSTITISTLDGSIKKSCTITVADKLHVQTSQDGDAINLSWNSIQNADYYEVVYYINGEDENGNYTFVPAKQEIVGQKLEYSIDISLLGMYTITVCAWKNDDWFAFTSEEMTVSTSLPQIEGLKTAFIGKNSIGLQWDEVDKVDCYLIYQYSNQYHKWISLGQTKKSQFVVNGLAAGTEYRFKVLARRPGIYNPYNTVDAIIDVTTAMEGIGGVSVTQAENGIELNWGDVENAKSYVIKYMTEDTDFEWETADIVRVQDRGANGFSYQVTNALMALVGGHSYFFRIYVYSDENTRNDTTYLGKTNAARCTYVDDASNALVIDLGIKATNTSKGCQISWTVPDAYSSFDFEVIKLNLDTASEKVLKRYDASTASHIDTKAKSGENCIYQIKVYDGDIYKGKTKLVSHKYLAKTTATLTKNAASLKLTWTKVTGAVHYKVYRSTNGTTYSLLKEICSPSTVTYTDASVTSGKKYYYYVVATDGFVNSEKSNVVSETFLAAPTGVTYANEKGGIRIKWNKVAGAKQYWIYREYNNTGVAFIVPSTVTTYLDNSVANGKTAKYKVYAVSGTAESVGTIKAFVRLANTNVSSLANTTAKKLTVKWAKNSSATGYQVQYSTSSKFTSPKTVTITKNTTVSTIISNLTKGKTYYVRIRSYKTVSGVKYYSAWGASKYLKLKK